MASGAKPAQEKSEKPKPERRARKPKDSPKPAVKTQKESPGESPQAKAPEVKKEAQRRDNNNKPRNNHVKGMGNHLPDFIAKSFDDRRTG